MKMVLNLPFPILRCLDVLSEIERWGKRLSLLSRFMEGTATQTQNKQIKEAESLCGWSKKARDQRALSLGPSPVLVDLFPPCGWL